MKSLRNSLTLLGGALLMLAFTSVASAQASRTWVSGVGDDANPCSRTAPCKTFAGAISKTANGGEIDCLDPGGFGAVTITKSLIIDCDSGAGGVLVSGTNGINIAANASTDVVILRNLTINGLLQGPQGLTGINISSAKTVDLEDVVINGFTQNCLSITSSASVFVTADDSKFIDCTLGGIAAGANAKVTVTRSFISGKDGATGQGISQSGAGSQVLITGSTVTNMGTAFQSSSGNFLGVSGCTLTNNGVIFNQNTGQIFTGADNPSFGNGATGATTAGFTKF
jgi:hypothetical protein